MYLYIFNIFHICMYMKYMYVYIYFTYVYIIYMCTYFNHTVFETELYWLSTDFEMYQNQPN